MDHLSSLPSSPATQADHQGWLQQNYAQLMARLAPLRDQPDGMLCFELSGSQFIVVSKRGSQLVLGLIEPFDLSGSMIVQSELDLEEPLRLATPYGRAILLGLLWPAQIHSILVAGLGGGQLPLWLHHYLPQAHLDCVEINPEVVTVARTYFGLPEDDRFQVHIQDIRDYLSLSSIDPPYDLMVLDLCLGDGSVPNALLTQEFYRCCQRHLSPEGVLVINWLSDAPNLADRLKTLLSLFSSVYYCHPEESNLVFFASLDPQQTWAALQQRALAYGSSHQLPIPLTDLVQQLRPCADLIQQMPQWEQARILQERDGD